MYKILGFHYEQACYNNGFTRVAGVDEAGRGAWAGPLVAAAVIFPRKFINGKEKIDPLAEIRDSKKLTAKKRERLYDVITTYALFYAIAEVSRECIDARGIQWANLHALTQAACNLAQQPDYVLSDGYLKPRGFVGKAIVRGDGKILSIAAASILAKVTRDRIMSAYDTVYPTYGFARHKGYGTKQHHEALLVHGSCELHRTSFAPIHALSKRLP